MRRGISTLFARLTIVLVIIAGLAQAARPQAAHADGKSFTMAEVFASVGSATGGNGTVSVFTASGTLADTLNVGTAPQFITGGCFDASGNFLATNFSAGTLVLYGRNGTLLNSSWASGLKNPESCTIDFSGNVWVGDAGSNIIREYSPSGHLVKSTAQVPVSRGTDWISLLADQCTMLYASESATLYSHNVCTDVQNPDFADNLGGNCYANAVRANGEVLVACSNGVHRLSSTGQVLSTYLTNDSGLFSLTLAPDGASFWAGSTSTGTIYHVDIASGNLLSSFSSGSGSSAVYGLAIPAAPASTVTFPAPGSAVDAYRWGTGCSPVGICGLATDNGSGAGIAAVYVTIKKPGSSAGTDQFWDSSKGQFVTSTSPIWTKANITQTSTPGLVSFNLPFALSQLPGPDGDYVIGSGAVDGAGYREATLVGAATCSSTCGGGGQLGGGGGQLGGGGGQLGGGGGQLGGGGGQLGGGGGQLGAGCLGGGGGQLGGGGGQLGGGGGQLGGNGGCDVSTTTVDTDQPTVSEIRVDNQTASGAVNIDPAATLRITFNEQMNSSSVQNNIQLYPGNLTPTCADPCFTATISGLQAATHYTLHFGTGTDPCACATDLAGNGLASTSDFTFTTAATSPITDASLAADPDNDGIPNAYDGTSFTVNGRSIDTGSWGFSPSQKDLCLVEDWMPGQQISHAANQAMVDSFARHGIHLVVFAGSTNSAGLPTGVSDPGYGQAISATGSGWSDPLGTMTGSGYDWTQFDAIKNAYFVPTGLAQVCHFAVLADRLGSTDATGTSRGLGASDMITALGGVTSITVTDMVRVFTAMHELGHNLALPHGGSDLINYKPNYLSVMNYGFQFSGVPEHGVGTPDYSGTVLPPLDETSLSELAGLGPLGAGFGTMHVCPGASGPYLARPTDASSNVNWNCNTNGAGTDIIDSANVPYDVNGDGHLTVLTGHDDWDNLNFHGGTIGFGVSLPPLETYDKLDTELDPSNTGPNTPTNVPASPVTIVASATTADGKPYGSGTWTNQTVTVHFMCGSTAAAITSCPADQTISADGAGQSVSGTATDAKGNQGSTTFGDIRIFGQVIGTCLGDAGHSMLQPINRDGSSVFKQGQTVPAKFRVCDANGVSISRSGFVKSFVQLQSVANSSAIVNEPVISTTPDTAFRWDSSGQQWIFNLSTKALASATRYYYEITLDDGSRIDFTFSLK